jgi:cytochrome c oxidase subunit 2
VAIDEISTAKSERLWAIAMVGVAAVMLFAIVWAGLALHMNPPSNIETVDPNTLHLAGEFTDDNLGTRVDTAGKITTRVVTAQFAFVPECVVVPQGMQVTFRFASPDVLHGLIVVGTNINTMVVPGYVSQVHTVFDKPGDLLMPCHEFCGLGHSQMVAHVRVVPISDFNPDENGRVSCADR